MNSSSPCFPTLAAVSRRSLVWPSVLAMATLLALVPGARAQANGDNAAGARADRRSMTPQDFQARMLGRIREQLGVTQDDEWALISERVTKVMDLRRAAAGGGFGGMMFAGARAGQSRGGPGRVNGNPEVAALQGAVADNLPDAEIKARLQRLRDVRKANDAALLKAQDDLRAVVTLRQEAMLVLAGLLP